MRARSSSDRFTADFIAFFIMLSSSTLVGLLISTLTLCGGYALSGERTRVLRALFGLIMTTIALLSLATGHDLVSRTMLLGIGTFADTRNIAVQGIIGVGTVMIAMNLLDGVSRPVLVQRRPDAAAIAVSSANRWLVRLGMLVIAAYALQSGVGMIPDLRAMWL
jgi:hypothetical protein